MKHRGNSGWLLSATEECWTPQRPLGSNSRMQRGGTTFADDAIRVAAGTR
jgi:hypothetical protein